MSGPLSNPFMFKSAATATGFYEHQINHSVRMQMGAGSRLRRTPSSAGNRQTWAISMWVKRAKLGDEQFLFEAGASGNQDGRLRMVFTDGDAIMVGTGNANLATSTAVFRDPAAFYHIHWKNTGGTNTVHVNGQQVISVSCSGDTAVNNTVAHGLGCRGGSGDDTSSSLEGYISEFLLFDGTAYSYTDVTDEKNGVLIPADPSSLTFGTNGTWLKFQTAADLDDDSSGNTNDWTASNLATHDQMLDTPTFDSSSNGGNFATIGGLEKNTGGFTFSEGNLKYAVSTNQRGFIFSQGVPESGKYYWEVRVTQFGGTQDHVFIGVCEPDKMRGNLTGSRGGAQVSGAGGYTVDNYHGAAVLDGSTQSGDSIGTARSVPQTFGIAIDRDNNTFKWTYDGSTYSSTYTIPSSGVLAPYIGSGGGSNTASGVFNFGADSTFAGLISAGGNADGNGYGNFSLAVPSGYVALCAANLPIANEIDPAQTDDNYPQKLFQAKTYSGTLTGAGVVNINHDLGQAPDFIWSKTRSTGGTNHMLRDSTRGPNKTVSSNTTDLEADKSGNGDMGSTFATSTTFPTNNTDSLNVNGQTFIAWLWRANGSTTSTNTQGSEDSTVQVDPSGHFSIVKWTGTNDSWGNAITVGHGLSAAPNVMFCKKYLGNADQWEVFFSDYGDYSIGGSNAACNSMRLDTDAAIYTNQSYKTFGGVMPTSTVFTVDGNNLNGSGDTVIAYCFANCEGYIKVGTYEGNGNADGTFVYTGFKPAFFMCKPLPAGAWRIQDDTRSPFNVANEVLYPNLDSAEENYSSNDIDILSNGVKMRASDTTFNQATTYVYLAMAHNPFKYATAR